MDAEIAVLFDMDGLLVDTEKLWFEVEARVVARLGGSWSHEHQARLVGGSWDATIAYMIAVTGSDVPAAVVGEWLMAGMTERLADGIEVMPGAIALLDALADEGVPLALVTSTMRALAEVVLKSIGPERFAVIVTADDVERTKPDPEPYLTAARLLGVDPVRCAVLEDSPNGVAAAAAAGCHVVAVPSVVPIAPAPGRLVAGSLLEVTPRTLRDLIS